ncbi:branched-chain amino acid aminotransferase [Paramicrobacterium agarici]|nr:branched-chain amino acid aminotransferase [Microbacterium agarici]TQO21492.1 branched-chain amino acid aminotransferase [Microbacterium agarici]
MTITTDDRSLAFARRPATTPAPEQRRENILADPGFGSHFTDHMVAIDWTEEAGWHDARLQPYGPIALQPASAVLHYGQEVFEGLKAYRHDDGSIWTFRPEKNAERLRRSARRLALPELGTADFLASLSELVVADRHWVPAGAERSLYLRPFIIANETFIGVRPARAASYFVIASPAGPYFDSGVRPVSIWISTEHARTARGGTGDAKCGGNYAASLLPQQEAMRNGCAQVLFADAETGTRVDEAGSMNLFAVTRDGALITPAASGSILEGITRDSVIQLARDQQIRVDERDVFVDELCDGLATGEITEIFATGTAAAITPIGQLKSPAGSWGSVDAATGPVTRALRDELTGIQHGRVEDRHGWLYRLDA